MNPTSNVSPADDTPLASSGQETMERSHVVIERIGDLYSTTVTSIRAWLIDRQRRFVDVFSSNDLGDNNGGSLQRERWRRHVNYRLEWLPEFLTKALGCMATLKNNFVLNIRHIREQIVTGKPQDRS